MENKLLELEERLEDLKIYENNPNRSVTPWGVNDINTLVKDTTVEHPDKKHTETKTNTWNKPPRVIRTNMQYTFKKVEDNSIPQPKQNKNTPKTNDTKNPETSAKPAPSNPTNKSLLNDIKSLKKTYLTSVLKLLMKNKQSDGGATRSWSVISNKITKW